MQIWIVAEDARTKNVHNVPFHAITDVLWSQADGRTIIYLADGKYFEVEGTPADVLAACQQQLVALGESVGIIYFPLPQP